MKKALKNYETAANNLAKAFCKKQEMDFDGWVGDKIGTIAHCNDFTFDIADIVTDIQEDAPVGLIIDWYYDTVDAATNKEQWINYYSYVKGLRRDQIEKD